MFKLLHPTVKHANHPQQGFTLLELVAVMLILGLLASLAIPRYMSVDAAASSSAIDAAVSELNGRESLIWADLKISESGYDEAAGDTMVWASRGLTPPAVMPAANGLVSVV